MALEPFRFQQFSVRHARSGMRVCTDATVFGAMAPVRGGERVLDIGAGSGLLSLIAAQLGAGEVIAVELSAAAYDEALKNFDDSPWRNRLRAVHSDIQAYVAEADGRFDLIISNPPFFDSHSKAREAARNQARHTDTLPYAGLVSAAKHLLVPGGLFYVLLPSNGVETLVNLAAAAGLHLQQQTDIRANEDKAAKVVALTFGDKPTAARRDVLTLYQAERVYTEEAAQWLQPFLLRFAE